MSLIVGTTAGPLTGRAFLFVIAIVAAWSPSGAAQQTFRSAVDTVAIYATVTDGYGAMVAGLDQRDFIVEDNGKARPITLFKRDVQPITVALLLDRSPSLFASAVRMQEAAVDFVGRLLPSDRATVGFFSHVVTLKPELTSDKDALIRRLGEPAPFPAGTALWDAIDAGRAAVSAESERRVVLMMTDAADNCSASDIDAVRRQIEIDGVMVYGVGVRGRESLQTREMRAITHSTGGWYFELQLDADVGVAMQQVIDELHRQYVIGFTPAVLDGRVHRLTVKSKRPGLTVRARRSYVAASNVTTR